MKAFRRVGDEGEIPMEVMVYELTTFPAYFNKTHEVYLSFNHAKWVGVNEQYGQNYVTLEGDDLTNWTTAIMIVGNH